MKKIVVCNFKANPKTFSDFKKILEGYKKLKIPKDVSLVICPPVVFSSQKNKNFKLGAQDVSYFDEGAHTGEVTSSMLKSLGFSYVIVGHSDKRKNGETDEIISNKILKVLKAGMTPILCVGEVERDKEGDFLNHLRHDIHHALKGVSKKLISEIILAYEPVWAIGKNSAGNMKGSEVYEMVIFLKKVLSEISSPKVGSKIKVLYGGSVDFKNAEEIVKIGNVEGLLIGRESLRVDHISEIIKKI